MILESSFVSIILKIKIMKKHLNVMNVVLSYAKSFLAIQIF